MSCNSHLVASNSKWLLNLMVSESQESRHDWGGSSATGPSGAVTIVWAKERSVSKLTHMVVGTFSVSCWTEALVPWRPLAAFTSMPNGPFQKTAAPNRAAYVTRTSKLRKARERKCKTDVPAFKLNTEGPFHHFPCILFIGSKSLDLSHIQGKGYYQRVWRPGGRNHQELSGTQVMTPDLSQCPSRI